MNNVCWLSKARHSKLLLKLSCELEESVLWRHGLGRLTVLCSDTQSCSTLCDTMDCEACQMPLSLGFPMRLQAGILEWVAISFSSGSSRPGDGTWISFITGGFFTAEPPGKSRRVTSFYQNKITTTTKVKDWPLKELVDGLLLSIWNLLCK